MSDVLEFATVKGREGGGKRVSLTFFGKQEEHPILSLGAENRRQILIISCFEELKKNYLG